MHESQSHLPPGSAGTEQQVAAKAALRGLMKAQLQRTPADERTAASNEVCARLQRSSLWQRARRILGYAPLATEVDILPLLIAGLGEGRLVALPQYDASAGVYRACGVVQLERDLVVGNLGVREPAEHCARIDLKELDLILVPGIAFDKNGHRLGRGGGFYDRLLADFSAVKCGLGFDHQVRAQIPVEPHDVLLDCIVTPSCWLEFGQQRHGDELVG